MKSYPSIEHSGKIKPNQEGYVFVKYDGSNLRFEWSKKRGWYKFGTKTKMFDHTSPIYGPSIDVFLNKYAQGIEEVILKDKKFNSVESVIVFCEWFGEKSFAGKHFENDPKELVLFDVNPHKKGILSPKDFLNYFGHLEVAELLCRTTIDKEFIESVRTGEFDCSSKLPIANKIPEGVICKGMDGNLWMCKIKTNYYLSVLKERLGNNWQQYWE